MSSNLRVGSGIDVHVYDPTVRLRLAGLDWPGEPGLRGHSDGDAVCHAVVDALLSAAGLGDIGALVGENRADTLHADSTEFITLAVTRLAEAGWQPVNVTVQVVAEHPRFSPRRAEAEARMTELVGAPVSVTATTSDGLGFTGRGEGVAALATALIERVA